MATLSLGFAAGVPAASVSAARSRARPWLAGFPVCLSDAEGLRVESPSAEVTGRFADPEKKGRGQPCGQLVAQDQIEEFDGIIQRQQPLVGRVVLDAVQREVLMLPSPTSIA